MSLNVNSESKSTGPVSESIRTKLTAALSPQHLDVVNESYMHKVAPGSETHFRVVVVSEEFRDQNRVARHRIINGLLADELAQGVHALAIETYIEEQWTERQEKMQVSPPCLGGENT